MKKIRYRFKRETLVRKIKVDLIKILWLVLELVVRTGENGMSIPIVEYSGRTIYELRVNNVVSSLSLPLIVDLVRDRRDRIVCDDVEVGSLRRADERSDVGPRKRISPLGAVDCCPCRCRTSGGQVINTTCINISGE